MAKEAVFDAWDDVELDDTPVEAVLQSVDRTTTNVYLVDTTSVTRHV
eukprot:CAMPEP_0194065168 /NCGR_PEP_ID=MMETSP0009_2-20130614/85005_1 /TAXON_ID=210454 /ORGANISM="Grammatophora oceanica, Strain CCMP 410" /LENGTH=46 /DNA_ID= /DNA_START= /DNA_END= /DNA_ORIENTATION=